MTVEWLNTRDLYVQYSYKEQFSWAARRLLERYGKFFDDEHSFWIAKSAKGRALGIVRRRPLWMKGKRMPAEKYHKKMRRVGTTKQGRFSEVDP